MTACGLYNSDIKKSSERTEALWARFAVCCYKSHTKICGGEAEHRLVRLDL